MLAIFRIQIEPAQNCLYEFGVSIFIYQEFICVFASRLLCTLYVLVAQRNHFDSTGQTKLYATPMHIVAGMCVRVHKSIAEMI